MLLLASGRGTRLGGEVPKAWVACRGRVLIARSLARLAQITDDREIVLAVDPADRAPHLEPLLGELRALGLDRVVDGGATRQQSMQRAFAACSADAGLVLVHDAARPFLPVEAARAALARAEQVGGAVLAVRAPDTLKRGDADDRVVETLDREGVWLAQTPQVCRRDLLERALERAARDGFTGTDDVSLLEHAGFPVALVESTPTNLKITTPHDLALAEAIAAVEDSRSA